MRRYTISQARGGVAISTGVGYVMDGRRPAIFDTEADAQAWIDSRTPAVETATPKQVDYIMTLLARRARDGQGGGYFTGPTTREGVAGMTRRDASTYIDSLTDRY